MNHRDLPRLATKIGDVPTVRSTRYGFSCSLCDFRASRRGDAWVRLASHMWARHRLEQGEYLIVNQEADQ